MNKTETSKIVPLNSEQTQAGSGLPWSLELFFFAEKKLRLQRFAKEDGMWSVCGKNQTRYLATHFMKKNALLDGGGGGTNYLMLFFVKCQEAEVNLS